LFRILYIICQFLLYSSLLQGFWSTLLKNISFGACILFIFFLVESTSAARHLWLLVLNIFCILHFNILFEFPCSKLTQQCHLTYMLHLAHSCSVSHLMYTVCSAVSVISVVCN
jgi:hypothetical protein